MASFDFTNVMLDEGTMFVFGSWICIANCSSCFNSHLAETSKLEAPAAISMSSSTTSMRCCSPILPGRSRRCPFSMQLQHVLHQDFLDRTQPDLRRPIPDSSLGYAIPPWSTKRLCSLSPSPTWRRTWIICSRSEMREQPLAEAPNLQQQLGFRRQLRILFG
jgi:hypothetical protein